MNRRRDFLTMTAGAVAARSLLPGASARASCISPDAELIAACNAWLSANRRFDRYYVSLPGDMEDNDPAWSILDDCPALQDQIIALRATTAEGIFAKAQCMAFATIPESTACLDRPGAAAEDRFEASMLRDLTALEWSGAVDRLADGDA